MEFIQSSKVKLCSKANEIRASVKWTRSTWNGFVKKKKKVRDLRYILDSYFVLINHLPLITGCMIAVKFRFSKETLRFKVGFAWQKQKQKQNKKKNNPKH